MDKIDKYRKQNFLLDYPPAFYGRAKELVTDPKAYGADLMQMIREKFGELMPQGVSTPLQPEYRPGVPVDAMPADMDVEEALRRQRAIGGLLGR